MQLELPDSPGMVVRRNQDKAKARGRVLSLSRRESYATRLVEESMERISEEDDMRAMAAARVRRNSADSSGSNGAGRRTPLSPSSCSDDGSVGLKAVKEEEENREEEEGGREEMDVGQANVSRPFTPHSTGSIVAT